MKIIAMSAAIGALTLTSACATVTRGSSDKVDFVSTPSMAAVTAQDVEKKRAAKTCTTPCTLELSRKWSHNVLFEKEGYQVVEALLTPQLSSAGATGMAGNLVLGGVIGVAVDANSGAMNDLEPNPLSVTLTAIVEAVEDAKPEAVETVAEAEEAVAIAADVAMEAAEGAKDKAEAAVDAAEAALEEASDSPMELTPPADS